MWCVVRVAQGEMTSEPHPDLDVLWAVPGVRRQLAAAQLANRVDAIDDVIVCLRDALDLIRPVLGWQYSDAGVLSVLSDWLTASAATEAAAADLAPRPV
jgi:hypothetical protein